MASSQLKQFYKLKSKEPNTTSDRRKARSKERSQLRDDQVNKRRNHVLSRNTSLAEDDQKTTEDGNPQSSVPATSATTVSRHTKEETLAERLKKWRAEKQKKREAEKTSKKPVFKISSNLPSSGDGDLFVKKELGKTSKPALLKEPVKINKPEVKVKATVSKPLVQAPEPGSGRINKKLQPAPKPALEKKTMSQVRSQPDVTSKQKQKPSGQYSKLTEAAKAKANPLKNKDFLRAKGHGKVPAKNAKDKSSGLHLSDSNVSTPKHSTPRKTNRSSKAVKNYKKTPGMKHLPRQIVTPGRSSRNISAIKRSPKRNMEVDDEQSVIDEAEVTTPPKPPNNILVGNSPGNGQNSRVISASENSCVKVTPKATNHQELIFVELNDENDVENPLKSLKSVATNLFDESEHKSPAKRPRRSVVQRQRDLTGEQRESSIDFNSAKEDEIEIKFARKVWRSGANSGSSSSTESEGDQALKCSNRRSLRKSSCSVVVSVSDEGTADASGEVYHVKKPALSDGLSHPLQELAVVKMDGEVSFIEVPLDESASESTVKKKKQLATTDNMESTQAFTPSLSVGETVHSSLDTPPKLCATKVMSTPLRMVNSPDPDRILRSRGRSIDRSSTFKTPGPSVSSVLPKSERRRRRKTDSVQIKSPEEMVEVLRNSPMVEMNRRKSRFLTSPGSSSSLSTQVDALLFAGSSSSLSTQVDALLESAENMKSSEKEEKIQNYRELLARETSRLNQMSLRWNEVLELTSLGEEVQGQIRSAIGKAQLLINQKFKQFSGLVDNCQFNLGEKETNPTDLQGFWEMIYFQVEDVDRLFADLVQLEANQWTKPATPLHKPVIKRVARKNKTKGIKPKMTSNFAGFRQEILKRKAKAANAVNDFVDMATVQDSGNVGDTFYVNVTSPLKTYAGKKSSPQRLSVPAKLENEAVFTPRISARKSYLPSVPSPLLKDASAVKAKRL